MAPPERDLWWSTVDFNDLPCECGHHALECLVAGGKVRVFWAVVFIRGDDGVVGPDLKHLLSCLRRVSINCKGVVGVVDGSPVRQ